MFHINLLGIVGLPGWWRTEFSEYFCLTELHEGEDTIATNDRGVVMRGVSREEKTNSKSFRRLVYMPPGEESGRAAARPSSIAGQKYDDVS